MHTKNKAVISNVKKKKKAGNHNSGFVLNFHQNRHDIRFDSLFIFSSLSIPLVSDNPTIIFFYSFAYSLDTVSRWLRNPTKALDGPLPPDEITEKALRKTRLFLSRPK